MKIGMITDSVGNLSFDAMLKFSAETGIEQLEVACGNWSGAPHMRLDEMLESASARKDYLAKIKDHGLELIALNCSGNQLAPGESGKRHAEVVRKTFDLAKLLDIPRVIMMSGLPGGPGDAFPNWIVTAWPPETQTILKYQWEEVAIPYWRDLVKHAANCGVERICIELHGTQLVYNAETMLRLRAAAGERVGANFDPSHMMWMGGDPLLAMKRLKGAIYHVHAKDTKIDPENAGINTALETKGNDRVDERAWNYVTLGFGHGESWWRDFIARLAQLGYDDVLSIEHEDRTMSPQEGMRRSVEFLQRMIIREAA
jgi:sugar phosphate isomerase/epimerase